MFLTKLKLAIGAVLCAGLILATAGGSLVSLGIAQDAGPKAVNLDGVISQDQVSSHAKKLKTDKQSGDLLLEEVDLVKGTIKGHRVTTPPDKGVGRFGSSPEQSWELLVKPTTKIIIDGKDAKLADLQTIKAHRPGDTKIVFVEAELEVSDGRKDGQYKGSAIRIEASGIQVKCVVQAFNADKDTITIKRISRNFTGNIVFGSAEEIQVAKDVSVKIDDRAVTLRDLKPETKVSLQMSAVKDLVLGITAYGATVEGV